MGRTVETSSGGEWVDDEPLTSAEMCAEIAAVYEARTEFYTGLILRLSFAIGVGALSLAVSFAVIYTFLRWVLA